MIEEFKEAVLSKDVPEKGLIAGDVGTVVAIHEARGDLPEGYTLEFMTMTGETLAVATLTADFVRPAGEQDLIHVREASSPANI